LLGITTRILAVNHKQPSMYII